MSIEVRDVAKSFDGFAALKGVSLEVSSGELVALLGPSGCGKTTLLRVVAGLERPDRGEVLHHDEPISAKSPRERNVGVVFQHYALFGHMTVFENVAFPLRVRRRPRREVEARVRELLELVQLAGLEHRHPAQLSGGQRQRVALARALASDPDVLLLDEPFGALDARVRQQLRRWLRRLHDEIQVTTVFVTHDQEEAFEVADRVVLMNGGRIEQVGSPREVFEEPASPFVLQFLGAVNVLHADVRGGRARVAGGLEFAAPPRPGGWPAPAQAFVRPHELEVHRPADSKGLPARVLRVTPLGASVRIELASDAIDGPLTAELETRRAEALALAPGERVHLSPTKAMLFADDAVPDSITSSQL